MAEATSMPSAILAFELFTGQLPFTGKSAQETMIARLRGAPLPLRAVRGDLPAKLEAVIPKALSVNPAERYGIHGGAGPRVGGFYQHRRAGEIVREVEGSGSGVTRNTASPRAQPPN